MQSVSCTKIIFKILDETYGHVDTFLTHSTPFQLLIAVILSAQTTDFLVNKVTPTLFEQYPDAKSMKEATLEEIELLIKQINYFRSKAKYLKETARIIDEIYQGIVPSSIDQLVRLPGVGRKVANVITAEIYNKSEGIVVDTHVKRVSFRIGWTLATQPDHIERDLMKHWMPTQWVNGPKQIILIGREYCHARKPQCGQCPLISVCERNGVDNLIQTE